MTDVDVRPASPTADASAGETPVWDRTDRQAAWVFAAFVAVAAGLLLFHFGRYHWFHGDEWDFLVDRDGGDLGDLLRGAQRAPDVPADRRVPADLEPASGLRSYLPYQVPVVALHLTAAVLLRALMRRCGVNPWIATAAAGGVRALRPGRGEHHLGVPDRVHGLARLRARAPPARRPSGAASTARDWIGVGFGFLGLLCSGLTPLTVGVVGVVVLVRRGWKPAAFNVLPLATIYLAWWLTIGPNVVRDPYNDRSPAISDITHFVWRSLSSTYESIAGGSPVLAIVLVVVLVAGLVRGVRAPARAGAARGRGHAGLDARRRARVRDHQRVRAVVVRGRRRRQPLPAPHRRVHAARARRRREHAGRAIGATASPSRQIAFVALIPYGASQFDTNDPWNANYFRVREELSPRSDAHRSSTRYRGRPTRPGLEQRQRRMVPRGAATTATCRRSTTRPPHRTRCSGSASASR